MPLGCQLIQRKLGPFSQSVRENTEYRSKHASREKTAPPGEAKRTHCIVTMKTIQHTYFAVRKWIHFAAQLAVSESDNCSGTEHSSSPAFHSNCANSSTHPPHYGSELKCLFSCMLGIILQTQYIRHSQLLSQGCVHAKSLHSCPTHS